MGNIINIGSGDVDVIKIGDANIDAVYQGESMIYPTVVNYLESTGTQYITIDGFVPSGTGYTFGGEINILGFTSQTQWITIWGTYVNENTNTYRLIRRADTDDILLAHNNTKAGGGGQQVTYVQGERYTYEFSDSEYVWGEDTFVNSGSTGGDNTATLQLYGRGAQGTRARIYSFWVKKDGVKILDLVPVKVDGVGYMFDKITHTLYGNSGTGDFIIG